MTTATTPATTTAPAESFSVRAGKALARRWPALLGTAFGLLSVDGLENGVPLGVALAAAAFGYLLVALVGRPELTWPAVFVLLGVVVGVRAAGGDPIVVLAVAAAVLAVVALASGRLRSELLRLLQAPGAWLFGGVAVAATLVSPELGGVLVALGLITHAAWDTVLWRARTAVVSRSFVEWCAAFDLVVGVGILALVV